MTRKKFIGIILASLLFLSTLGQNMNSPYSIYGIGDIDSRMYNRTSGMGGAGLATRSASYYIDNNPAAISGLPRSFYLVNVPLVAKSVQYSGTTIVDSNRTNRDLWVKGLALAVKINKFWASSAGFKQYSNVNYKFSGAKNVTGSADSYNASYDGTGGLNDYYWTNAFAIGKHFAIGIKSSIIAGSINRTESIINASSASTIDTKQQDYFGSPKFEFGAIYSLPITKTWDLSLGAKYNDKTKLKTERSVTVTANNTTIVNDNLLSYDHFYLPRTYGVGFSLTHNKKTTFAADYAFESWSPLNINGSGWRLVNSTRLSAGVEIGKLVDIMGQKVEKNYFQLGGFVSNSYLEVQNTPINEFGITAGTGGRLGGSLLYTLSLEGGKRGTTTENLIKENFFQLTISLTYRDFLFSKGKKYD